MRFRIPMKSLLRDFTIMFCGSLLGLFLSRAIITDTTFDQCNAVHMVKRKISSGSGRGGSSSHGGGYNGKSVPWIAWAKGLWNISSGDNTSDVASDGGWGDETKDDLGSDTEDDDFEFEYAKPRASQNGGKQAGTNNAIRNITGTSPRRKTLVVGVITEKHALQTTMTDVAATWGQDSSDILFYSIHVLKNAPDVKTGKGSVKKSLYKKSRHGRSSKDEGRWTAIEMDAKKRNNVQPLVSETLKIIQHMHRNLLNLYDWFAVVPDNTYVSLTNFEKLLEGKNPTSYVMLGGHLPGKKNHHPDTLPCDEVVGMVISHALLAAVGSLVQSADVKSGSGEDLVSSCAKGDYTSFGCLSQKMGVECIHDYQENHVFKSAESALSQIKNSTQYSAHLSAPSPVSMYTLHQHYLQRALEKSLAQSSALRSRLIRNTDKLKSRTR